MNVTTEVAVAVNWKTGEARIYPDVKNRGYPDLGPDWMFGTADILGEELGQFSWALYVGDWKTGGSDGANEQLLSLLYGFRTAFMSMGRDEPAKMVIACLSLNEHGCWVDEREVTTEELIRHQNNMRVSLHEVNDGETNPEEPGLHCTTLYCPHLAYCKSITSILEELADTNNKQKVSLPMLTDNPQSMKEAADTMSKLTAAKRQLNYLIDCMKAYVNNGGRIISGNQEWGPGPDGFRWRKIKSGAEHG